MAYVVRTLRDSFTPLRLPNLRTYLIGQAISLLGTWMQVTAQGWLVWELSKSEVALGIVSMLGSLPLLLFGLWAGVWADRFDRRKILIGTQAGAMVLAFILAALAAGLAGCAGTVETTTPHLDQYFGQAVNQAKAQQTLNPDASRNTDPVAGVDGKAAQEALDSYHEGMKTPAPATIINIGGGLTGSTGR